MLKAGRRANAHQRWPPISHNYSVTR